MKTNDKVVPKSIDLADDMLIQLKDELKRHSKILASVYDRFLSQAHGNAVENLLAAQFGVTLTLQAENNVKIIESIIRANEKLMEKAP